MDFVYETTHFWSSVAYKQNLYKSMFVNFLSEAFSIRNRVKYGDLVSAMLFNFENCKKIFKIVNVLKIGYNFLKIKISMVVLE